MDQDEQTPYVFTEVCPQSIFCKDNSCQLNHSRVFVGVCVEYLRNEQKFYDEGGDEYEKLRCNNKDCNLWHFKNDKFSLSKQTINGIFPHNLCPKSCGSENCGYLHRAWAEKVCFDQILKGSCRKKQCDFEHVKWELNTLKERARSCSLNQDTTPEDLCEKEKCNCGKHPPWLNDYCILYLKGLCPRKKCIKNHTDWEKINTKINQKNAVKSCITIAQERKKKIHTTPEFNEIQLLCEKSEFEHYKKWFQEQNMIDVVIIMDLTGSMKPWKETMQQTIAKIIDQFLNSINGYQVRVAFIGYRDIWDNEEKLVYWSFTKKIPEIQEYISKLEAKGGDDEAEDIVSAFELALKLDFSHNPDSILCTFLIADAPCHGREYHNIESDHLIDKMPKHYFQDVLEKYKQIKKNNFLCCVKINNRTDIMFQKMKAVIPMMIITAEKKPEDLFEVVGFTLRMSVTESKKLKSQINNQIQYFQAEFEKLKLDTLSEGQDDEYWKNYVAMIESMKRKGITGLKVIVDKKELNKENDNSSTYIFKAFDAINNREIIIKIPKKLVDNQGKISDQEISEAEELAQTRFYSSGYACQMAYLFNQKLKVSNLLNEMQPIFYAHPILYTLDRPFFGMTKVYGETYLQIQFKFEKYTTNSSYIEKDKYFYSAFSHFTYQISNKILVIMDLQGCNNIFSDPSIQTDQSWSSILDKDETNRKNKGIEEFKLTQHKDCSYLCKKLNLPEINQNSKINENKCPKELISNINGICYDCDEFVKGDMDQIKNLKDKKFKFNCNFCLTEQNNQINQECKCCYYIFQTPLNNQIKQLTNLGQCIDCKSKCQGQKNLCHYCKRSCQKIMKQLNINDQVLYICENALEYLQALKCKKCNKPYNKKSIISLEDYNGKSFSCC